MFSTSWATPQPSSLHFDVINMHIITIITIPVCWYFSRELKHIYSTRL
jgi:hypothetical protein